MAGEGDGAEVPVGRVFGNSLGDNVFDRAYALRAVKPAVR